MIENLIFFLGGSSVLLASVGWLTKSIVSHYLTKDVEIYKQKIKYDLERELEEFKYKLQIEAQQKHIMFTKLHEKRAEILVILYEKVQRVQSFALGFAGSLLFCTGNIREERSVQACNASKELIQFYNSNRIYFPETVEIALHELVEMVYGIIQEYDASCILPDNKKKFEEKFSQSISENSKMFSSINKMIEHEFKVLLGADT